MLASILIRLGGVAAMVGGVASATLGVLTVLVLGLKYEIPGSIEKAIQKGGWEPRVANMLLIGALAAILALHALQRQRYGSRGTLAALAAFIGLVLLPVGGSWLWRGCGVAGGWAELHPCSDNSCACGGCIGGFRGHRGLRDSDHQRWRVTSLVWNSYHRR
jgi:hypothetical protein